MWQWGFGCPLQFDSEFNGLVCRASDLDAPNPAAAPALARYAQRFVDSLPHVSEPSVVQEVRKAIYLMLASGQASTADIASSTEFPSPSLLMSRFSDCSMMTPSTPNTFNTSACAWRLACWNGKPWSNK